jgi:hypothetical protein
LYCFSYKHAGDQLAYEYGENGEKCGVRCDSHKGCKKFLIVNPIVT